MPSCVRDRKAAPAWWLSVFANLECRGGCIFESYGNVVGQLSIRIFCLDAAIFSSFYFDDALYILNRQQALIIWMFDDDRPGSGLVAVGLYPSLGRDILLGGNWLGNISLRAIFWGNVAKVLLGVTLLEENCCIELIQQLFCKREL